MKQLTRMGAEHLSDALLNLHTELSRKFGDDRAWEFILAFYEGTARDDK